MTTNVKSKPEKPIDRCPVMSGLRGKSPESGADLKTDSGVSMDGSSAALSEQVVVSSGPVKRLALMVLGVAFVFLAAVGVFLPGLPATGPLILASICLTKSCPWLEQRLVRSRFFAPFHRYLDGNAEMPWKAKVVAMVMMWACILVSSVLLVRSGEVAKWIVALIVLSGFLGTFVIARIGKRR